MQELAAERPCFGYRRLHVLLRREGTVVNHKRVERLSREEGLTVRKCGRKRAARDGGRPLPVEWRQPGEAPDAREFPRLGPPLPASIRVDLPAWWAEAVGPMFRKGPGPRD